MQSHQKIQPSQQQQSLQKCLSSMSHKQVTCKLTKGSASSIFHNWTLQINPKNTKTKTKMTKMTKMQSRFTTH